MIRNVIEYLEKTAERYPNKVAVIDENRQITFGELREEAIKIAKRIHCVCGELYHEPIAVYMKKSVECIIAFCGIAYSGNFYSPIDLNSPLDRIDRIMSVLQPKVILHDEKAYDGVAAEAVAISMREIADETGGLTEKYYEKTLDVDPLYVLFTSGSTGQPKGVVISQKGVIDYTEWLADTFSFNEFTVFGNQAPFYFDNSILDIYSTLRNGSTMVIIPERLFTFPGRLLEFIKEKKINTLFWVPSALISVANAGVLSDVKLEDLQKVLFCGEVMPNRQLNIWRYVYPDLLYANLYGPTEITDVCTYYVVDREFRDDEPLPIGCACKNTQVLVINEANELVGAGEIGELCVRGTCLSMGYYGDREKTEQVFVQNPLHQRYHDLIYRTGDLVKYNEKGEIIYVSRKDFQIKHQGHRIELGEIETAANSLEEVLQSCALYDDNHKKIILICKVKEGIAEKEIYKKLKSIIPKYMLPSKIRLLEEMPLNLNGKIDRNRLRKEQICDEYSDEGHRSR